MKISEQITWLYVEDLDRSTRFYTDSLPARVVLDQSSCRVLEITDSALVGLCERPQPRGTPGLLLCFVTEEVDEAFGRLVAAGGQVDKEPALNDTYGIYHGFVRDPDGHRVEVQRFLDPRWRQG